MQLKKTFGWLLGSLIFIGLVTIILIAFAFIYTDCAMVCAMNPMSRNWLASLDIAFLYALTFIFFSLAGLTLFIFLIVSLTKIRKKIVEENYDLTPFILKLKKNAFLFGAILMLIASAFAAIYLMYVVLFPNYLNRFDPIVIDMYYYAFYNYYLAYLIPTIIFLILFLSSAITLFIYTKKSKKLVEKNI